MKSAVRKNLDPSISSYIDALFADQEKKYKDVEKQISHIKSEIVEVRTQISDLKNEHTQSQGSLEAFAKKINTTINNTIMSLQSKREDFAEATTALVQDTSDSVNKLESKILDLNQKMDRYFRKEKYEITKGLITKIINEERSNG